MIVEGRAPPERRDGALEPLCAEGGQDFFAGREMERRLPAPGGRLREAFRQMGQPKTRVAVARTIADDEHSPGRDARRELLEQTSLFVRLKIMQ